MAASLEHMEEEILAQKTMHGREPSIFMVGSNPFTLPFGTLKQYAGLLLHHFPNFVKISMCSRVDGVAKKTDDE